MEGCMLSVGYPVGVNVKNQTYMIELAEGLVDLQVEEVLLWVQLNTMKQQEISEEMVDIVKKLVEKRVLYSGNTIEELFYNIQNIVLHRQGCFSIDDGKYAIYVGKEICYPTMEQSIIWKYADGNNSIQDICEFMQVEKNIDNFMKNLRELLAVGLVMAR